MARFGFSKKEHLERARPLSKLSQLFARDTIRALRNENCPSALNHLMRLARVNARLVSERQGAGKRGGTYRALRSLERKFKKACVVGGR